MIGWINVMCDPEHFFWLSLRFLNFSERESLPLGIVTCCAGLETIGHFLALLWVSKRYGHMAVENAEKVQHPGALGIAYQCLAMCEIYRGELNRAIEHGRRGADAYRKGSYWNLHGWGVSVYFVYLSYLLQGNLARASTYAHDLIQYGQGVHDVQIWSWGLMSLGYLQERKGDFKNAIANLEKAVELAEAVPDYRYRVVASSYLGKSYLHQGDLDRALSTFEECESYRAKHKMRGYFPALFNGIANVYLLLAQQASAEKERIRLDEARSMCKVALKQGEKYAIGLAEAMRLKGTYEWLRHKPDSATKSRQESLQLAEDMGMRYELAMTRLEMGQRLKERAHLEKAEALFAEIGAEWDLGQTRKLLKLYAALDSGVERRNGNLKVF